MDERILRQIRRRLMQDKQFIDDCKAYDDIDDMNWSLPRGLAVHEWVRKRVSTDGHDILKTAINLFDTRHPKWEILPRGPEDGDTAEELERWLEWIMMRANTNGDRAPNREMLRHSAKYGRIAAQIDFYPYWCKEGTDEYKQALANPFCITVHPAANIRYERGKYGLRWVANVSNVPAAEIIDHWNEYAKDATYGAKIKSAIAKIEKLLKEDKRARLMYVDYTDREKRWVFAYHANGDQLDMELQPPEKGGEPGEWVEIMNADNKLGFIPWAVSVADSEPLLHSMHRGGIWENQNFLDTISDSVVLRRGFFPLLKHKSVGGKTLDVDFTGAEAVAELDTAAGEELEVMVPPPLDRGISELMDRNSQKAASATGLKGLQNMDVTGNVQYAAVAAQLQVSKSVLDPYLTAWQHAAVELARLAFMWIKKSGVSVTALRMSDKNREKNKVRGQKINVGPDQFDPQTMQISCELLSTNTSDELQRMNVFSQAVQIGLPISKAEIAERMGWGEADVLKADWLKEKIEEIALAAYQKQKDAELTLMVQQQQMQMQMAAQQAAAQPPAPQGPPGMSPPEQMGGAQMMPGGIGNDPNAGGAPPAMSSPQETRTATQRPGP